MKFQGTIKFSLRFDIIAQNLSEGDMKNFIFLWLLLAGCAFGAAKEDAAASTTQQAASNLPQPNFEAVYDDNASDEQIDAGLDALLEFAAQNRGRIDEDFGEFKDRIFTAFIFNPKVLRNSKFDFERIEKILKFKPNLNYGGDGGFFSPPKPATSPIPQLSPSSISTASPHPCTKASSPLWRKASYLLRSPPHLYSQAPYLRGEFSSDHG